VKGCEIKAYARRSGSLVREGSLSCHTCYDKGPVFPVSFLWHARGWLGPTLTLILMGHKIDLIFFFSSWHSCPYLACKKYLTARKHFPLCDSPWLNSVQSILLNSTEAMLMACKLNEHLYTYTGIDWPWFPQQFFYYLYLIKGKNWVPGLRWARRGVENHGIWAYLPENVCQKFKIHSN
jgi:hypothetical protein